jgi:SagB-type dehydrogenase family enzyme
MATLVLPISAITAGAEEKMQTVASRFHSETSFKGKASGKVVFGDDVPLYKTYPRAPIVKLPKPDPGGMTVKKAIGARRSVRAFASKPITLKILSQLCLSANGLTHSLRSRTMRAAPSAGAMYPIELYAYVQNVTGLDKGFYHFRPKDSSLERVTAEDIGPAIHEASLEQESIGVSPLILILTARFDRSTSKYADRGYRYVYIDAGAMCENIYLQATSLGLGTVAAGAFNDDAVNKVVGVDGKSEAVLLIMPVGYPGD